MSAAQLIHLAVFGVFLIAISRKLPKFALSRPVTLSMILSAIILFGAAALIQLPVELMPNVSYGNVTIFMDVRGGMPPPEIERLITKPTEAAMGTVSKLRNLVSSSKKDRAVVTLEFDPGTDMDLAAMEVREKFLRVRPKLPPEIEKPIIARYEESDAPVFIAALTSDRYTPEELRLLVDNDIREKLMRVGGVANVEVGGGRERKIIVDIDRDRLAAFHLSILRVVEVLERNNLNLRAGEVKGPGTLNLGVRTLGAFRTVEDIRDMTLAAAPNGGRIRVKDVADVNDSYLESESYSRLNAKAAVTLYIQKESSANTVRTAAAIEREMGRFRSGLPEGIDLVVISNQKKAILSAIHSVRATLIYGVVLVILVLPFFLAKTRFTRTVTASLLVLLIANVLFFYCMRWSLDETLWPVIALFLGVTALAFYRSDIRTSFVVALSIPTAVCVTLALMFFEGVSINVMSLSGLIIGIGLLVDNAVVVIENYDRILADHRDLSPKEAMVRAADEMIPPMVGGTLTTVVVFLPFSLLQKQAQMLFSGITFTVTASVFSSLFIALTLVPALGCRLDPRKRARDAWDGRMEEFWRKILNSLSSNRVGAAVLNRRAGFNPASLQKRRVWAFLGGALAAAAALYFALEIPLPQGLFVVLTAALIAGGLAMMTRYGANLFWCLDNKKPVFTAIASFFLIAILFFLFVLPKDFMAASEQSEFVVFVELDTGVRLDISNRIVEEVEKVVRDFPKTKDSIKSVSSKVEGWSSKVYVTLKDLSERPYSTQQVINILRQEVDKAVEKYAKDYKAFSYFSEPRTGKEVFVEIFGYEYDLMAKLAMELAGRMGELSDLSDVKIRYRPRRPQLSILVDPMRASFFGLNPKEVADTLHAQMRGLRATTFFDQSNEIETVVRVRPEQRETVNHLKNLMITTRGGEQIPLRNIASVEGDLSPSEIWHRNKSRMIQVSANLGAASLAAAADRIRGIVDQISFPPEYYADIGGQYEDMVAANRDFWRALALTIFLIFMVMACQFESLSQPFVIMGTVLLSAIGAVAALLLFKTEVTLGVLVGLLMLGGIVVNNGIMLIDRINSLKKANPSQDLRSLILEAGIQRIRPIFMTKATAVLGLLPMALDRSESAALWSPLAITVIGGLVSSSLLTLFVIPCVYVTVQWIQENFRARLDHALTWARGFIR